MIAIIPIFFFYTMTCALKNPKFDSTVKPVLWLQMIDL